VSSLVDLDKKVATIESIIFKLAPVDTELVSTVNTISGVIKTLNEAISSLNATNSELYKAAPASVAAFTQGNDEENLRTIKENTKPVGFTLPPEPPSTYHSVTDENGQFECQICLDKRSLSEISKLQCECEYCNQCPRRTVAPEHYSFIKDNSLSRCPICRLLVQLDDGCNMVRKPSRSDEKCNINLHG
jgi:hypothetical protein